jgi:hypothetical protein
VAAATVNDLDLHPSASLRSAAAGSASSAAINSKWGWFGSCSSKIAVHRQASKLIYIFSLVDREGINLDARRMVAHDVMRCTLLLVFLWCDPWNRKSI